MRFVDFPSVQMPRRTVIMEDLKPEEIKDLVKNEVKDFRGTDRKALEGTTLSSLLCASIPTLTRPFSLPWCSCRNAFSQGYHFETP